MTYGSVPSYSPIVAANAAGIPYNNLACWLDAADETSLITDASGNITRWLDHSGNGVDFTFTSGTPVVTEIETTSGHTVLVFGNGSEFQAHNKVSLNFLHESASTVFVVAKSAGSTNGDAILFSIGNPGYQLDISSNYYGSTNVAVVNNTGAVVSLITAQPGPKPTPNTYAYITAISIPGAAVSARAYLRVNGVNTGTVNSSTATLSTGDSGIRAAMASNNAMRVAEVLIYDAQIDDADIAAVEAYLNAKWFGAGAGPQVTSVNSQTGNVVLNAADVGAATAYTVNSVLPSTDPDIPGGALPFPMLSTMQPTVQPGGVVQPLPPLFGFSFNGGFQSKVHLAGSMPACITPGFDHNVWVADQNGKAWAITLNGVPTSYTLAGSSPLGICTGPDMNIWVADTNGMLWQIATNGGGAYSVGTGENAILPFAVPAGSKPNYICTGPDGSLYYTDPPNSAVYQVNVDFVFGATPTLVFTKINVGSSLLGGICAGPDGQVWVAAFQGVISITTGASPAATYHGITGSPLQFHQVCTGADGNIYATSDGPEPNDGLIYPILPNSPGAIHRTGEGNAIFPSTFGLCSGGGGDIWVVDPQGGHLVKVLVDPSFAMTAFTVSDGGATPHQAEPKYICVGGDGSFWMSDPQGYVWISPFILQTGGLNLNGGDLTFNTNGMGPVIVDQSDGHTYRIISTAGVLSTHRVT